MSNDLILEFIDKLICELEQSRHGEGYEKLAGLHYASSKRKHEISELSNRKNIVQDFLTATTWRKFATVDFVHFCHRKGWAIPDQDAKHILDGSPFIEPTTDGMWRSI